MAGISLLQILVFIAILFGGSFVYRKIFNDKQCGDNNMGKKDYSQAILISKLVAFIGWIAFIFGIIGISISLSGNANNYSEIILVVSGLAMSIITALFGLVLIIAGQASRAIMDNANYSAAILEELKQLNSVEKARN